MGNVFQHALLLLVLQLLNSSASTALLMLNYMLTCRWSTLQMKRSQKYKSHPCYRRKKVIILSDCVRIQSKTVKSPIHPIYSVNRFLFGDLMSWPLPEPVSVQAATSSAVERRGPLARWERAEHFHLERWRWWPEPHCCCWGCWGWCCCCWRCHFVVQ